MSYMFEHVVNEYKAQSILAARGAEIFKRIISHKVAVERDKESRVLEKLKENVERIRQHQAAETTQEPKDHYSAVRSGDYYMFDAEFEIDDELSSDLEEELPKKSILQHKDSKLTARSSTDDEPIDIKKAILSTALIVQSFNIPQVDKKQSWLTIENKTLLKIFSFLKKYFFLLLDFVTNYINKHSKDFRLVSHMLAKEKVKLKRRDTQTTSSTLSEQSLLDEKDIIIASREVDNLMNSQSRLDKFLTSVFYFALSQSEFICYFFMILNHLKSASLLSVPLPISIFLWAMLCIPRPTKTYWITSITYIEAVVVVKYLFQFKFFPWNQSSNVLVNEAVQKVILIIGIEKQDQFAVFDLFALLVIFLHRTILKRLGLWRDYLAADDELLMTSEENYLGLEKNQQDPKVDEQNIG